MLEVTSWIKNVIINEREVKIAFSNPARRRKYETEI